MIEVVISIALIGIALLSLAQLFSLSVLNNMRAEKMAKATFLAQEQIDYLRNFTADGIMSAVAYPYDEMLDINYDGYMDFRRITKLEPAGNFWRAIVLVFSGYQEGVTAEQLLADPQTYKVFANLQTLIAR